VKKKKNSFICDDEEEEEIRAPIPQRQQVLVEDQYHALPFNPRPRRVPHSVFNICRDFQKESEEHEEMIKNQKAPLPSRKRKRLHDLFQPPVDLIHLGDFQSARDICNTKKKWLLVNIQNSREFACQVVNRDVWSNQIVRDIINANFIMWQVAHDSDEGLHYATFYTVKHYPHISVIDPRTGERLAVWESFGNKPSADQFAELTTHFLSEHPNLNDSFEVKDDDKAVEKKSVIDLCEEEQLKTALAASRAASYDPVVSENECSSDAVDTEDNNNDSTKHQNCINNKTEEDIKLPEETQCSSDVLVNNDNSNSSSAKESDDNKNISDDSSSNDFSTYVGEKATILLRLPDNGRKQILFPLQCTLKDLSVELCRLGWSDTKYEVIKAFPRQNVSQLNQQLTLKDAGLHKQETLFIQDR